MPWLLGHEQGYVSFLTALSRHGVISQIPPKIQIAITGHSRTLVTPVGTFEFFQLKPSMMLPGVERSHTHVPFQMASPEKALLDIVYIATRKGRRFASLPEMHRQLNKRKLFSLLHAQHFSVPILNAIKQRLQTILSL